MRVADFTTYIHHSNDLMQERSQVRNTNKCTIHIASGTVLQLDMLCFRPITVTSTVVLLWRWYKSETMNAALAIEPMFLWRYVQLPTSTSLIFTVTAHFWRRLMRQDAILSLNRGSSSWPSRACWYCITTSASSYQQRRTAAATHAHSFQPIRLAQPP